MSMVVFIWYCILNFMRLNSIKSIKDQTKYEKTHARLVYT